MKNLIAVVAAGTVVIGGLAACSSGPAPVARQQPGTERAGTATLTINDQDAGTTQDVSCLPAGTLTTIHAGTEQAGATIVVSSDDALTVQSVNLHNLNGFTGTYNQGLGGDATVAMIGRTYQLLGTADGFDSADPSSRKTRPFSIAVSC